MAEDLGEEYDPEDDDGLNYSETALDDAAGFVIISEKKLSNSEQEKYIPAIEYWSIDPIQVKEDQHREQPRPGRRTMLPPPRTLWLYAGVAGV